MSEKVRLVSLKTLARKYAIDEEKILNLGISGELFLLVQFEGYLLDEKKTDSSRLGLWRLNDRSPNNIKVMLHRCDIVKFFSNKPAKIRRALVPIDGALAPCIPIADDINDFPYEETSSSEEVAYPTFERHDIFLMESQAIKLLGTPPQQNIPDHSESQGDHSSQQQLDKTYTGWDEITAAWVAHGQKRVTPKQMKTYRDSGLAITYIKHGKKDIPTCTDQAIKAFIFHQETKKK